VERLTRELATAQQAAADAAAAPTPGNGAAAAPSAPARSEPHVLQWVAAVCAALGLGFWCGYAALARRIKAKFGGIKVY
jgi:hypothetical protein